jgi:hypothetical protein
VLTSIVSLNGTARMFGQKCFRNLHLEKRTLEGRDEAKPGRNDLCGHVRNGQGHHGLRGHGGEALSAQKRHERADEREKSRHFQNGAE